MSAKRESSKAAWVDPDDAPEWTKEMFDHAEHAQGGRVITPATGTVTRRPGRPPSAHPKTRLTLRVDTEVIEHFRATGPGWQTRINEALKTAVKS